MGDEGDAGRQPPPGLRRPGAVRGSGSAVLASVNVQASSTGWSNGARTYGNLGIWERWHRSYPRTGRLAGPTPAGGRQNLGKSGRRPRYAPADDIPRQRGPPVTLPAPAPAAPEALATPVRYAAWAVYARTGIVEHAADATAELRRWADALADDDVVLRGLYDVSGLRADADLMVWLHGPDRRGPPGRAARRSAGRRPATRPRLAFSLLGTHRPAEFTRDHVPSFMRGTRGAGLAVRVPVRALVRLVPAARGRAARDAPRARPRGPRVPARPGEHRRRVRASTTTSGSSRSRRTSSTTSWT